MNVKKEIVKNSIEGCVGGIVNVGDKVVVITTGYSHRVNVKEGTYLGYIEGAYGKRAKVEIVEKTRVFVHNKTGENYNYWKHGSLWDSIRTDFTHVDRTYHRITTLQLNRIATIKPNTGE